MGEKVFLEITVSLPTLKLVENLSYTERKILNFFIRIKKFTMYSFWNQQSEPKKGNCNQKDNGNSQRIRRQKNSSIELSLKDNKTANL